MFFVRSKKKKTISSAVPAVEPATSVPVAAVSNSDSPLASVSALAAGPPPDLATAPEVVPLPEALTFSVAEVSSDPEPSSASRRVVTVLSGSLRGLESLIAQALPDVVIQTVNEFLSLAESRVASCGGQFSRERGSAFMATWGLYDSEEGARNPSYFEQEALRCALALIHDFRALREARKLDGLPHLPVALGLHTAEVVCGWMGALTSKDYGWVGELSSSVRALERLAAGHGVALVVSALVAESSDVKKGEANFRFEALGEARLSSDGNRLHYYRVSACREGEAWTEVDHASDAPTPLELERAGLAQVLHSEQRTGVVSEDPSRPSLVVAVESPKRWLINNGSQILGPMEATDVAKLLFAQEIDFDCECWSEGQGKTQAIRDAGIFSGSEDTEGSLYVFDGQTIHGPLTQGFLNTALRVGAISHASWICEKTALSGWAELKGWQEKVAEQAKLVAEADGTEVKAAA